MTLACSAITVASGNGATLKKIATINLPGPPGNRFDYHDCQHNYLLSAHLAAGLLYVIGLRTTKLVKAIPDVPGVEGVEYAPEQEEDARPVSRMVVYDPVR